LASRARGVAWRGAGGGLVVVVEESK
jgi:hypothetical protein